jgi:ribosomal protein S18 acetylase RimI-like enzyme
MNDLELIFEPFPGDDLSRFVSEHVETHALVQSRVSDWHPVGFFLRSPRGEWLGGLLGHVWGGWLHVKFLWVSELARGQGQGTRLMDEAEAFALERGAFAATLETHSFQAPGFYAKRGYEVFGRLDNYPPGHTKFFLRKPLGPTPARPG